MPLQSLQAEVPVPMPGWWQAGATAAGLAASVPMAVPRKVAAPGSCWLRQGRVAAPGSLATRGNVAASLFSHVVFATPGKPGLWLA